MASFFGMGGANSNFYSSMFGNSNSQYSQGLSLGDYALIQKGTYKRLLKSYFAKTTDKESTDTKKDNTKTEGITSGLTEADKKAQKNLLETRGAATDLSNAAKAVQGLNTDDMEEASKKVKTFVDAYNKTIDKAGEVDARNVLQKTMFMVNNTKSSQNQLKNVGITVGENNKLTFDAEVFKKAQASDVKAVFSGYSSFAGNVSSKANEIDFVSKDAANKIANSGVYNSRGKVEALNTNSLYNSLF